jgi:4'-phosphopantetheinyl transferase
MKRNVTSDDASVSSTLRGKIVWASRPVPEVLMAGCRDDDSLTESELLSHLSEDERTKVHALTNVSERRHLAFRRCFQRHFLADVIGWDGRKNDIKLEHKTDAAPRLPDVPTLRFSFSSSGGTFLACASFQRVLGIDIERIRLLTDPVGLSLRFFTPTEAAAIQRLPENERSSAFLKFWTAKEAGLKAIGKGVDSGLNTFLVTLSDGCYDIETTEKNQSPLAWKLQFPDFLPGYIVAVIHRPITS